MKKYVILLVLLLFGMTLVGCGKDRTLCIIEDCQESRIENADYCEFHKCYEDGCLNLKIGARYCEEHFKCSKCNNEKNDNSQYCLIHNCKERECVELCVEGHDYCNDHIDKYRCIVSGCTNDSHSGVDGYCKEHEEYKCKTTGCMEMRYNNEEYCYEHYQEEQEKIAEERKKSEETQKLIDEALNEVKDKVIVDSNGKKIWRVCMIDDEFRFKANYSGNGNFIVTVLDYNQDYYATICNEIGDYVVDKTIPVEKYGYYYIETYTSGGSWSGTWWGTHGE